MKTKFSQFLNKEKPLLFIAIVLVVAGGFYFAKNGLARVKGAQKRSYPIIIQIDSASGIYQATTDEPEKVLAENNVRLWPEDKIETNLSLDPIIDGGVGQKIIIRRAPVFYVNIDRKKIEVRSWDQNVAAILEKSGAVIHGKDIIRPGKESALTPGGEIVVTRVNEEDIDILESVEFSTVYKASKSVSFGQKVVTQEGKKGQIKKTYHVVYRDGVEVSRWLKSTTTTIQKQDKIITTGIITGRANFGYYSGMVTSFYKGMTGHHLLVTNLANGKQVTVEIIGSGPFNGPLMDMGTEPFKAIGGSLSSGYIPSVSVQLLD